MGGGGVAQPLIVAVACSLGTHCITFDMTKDEG